MIFFSMLGRDWLLFLKKSSFFNLSNFFNLFLLFSAVVLVEYVGKFGALFASIPFTIFAAVYCVMFGLVGKQVCFLLFFHHHLSSLSLLAMKSVFSDFPSFSGLILPAIHKHEFNEEPLHHWSFPVPWFVNS